MSFTIDMIEFNTVRKNNFIYNPFEKKYILLIL